MDNLNIAFAEKVPSFFIVQTPFQAMCAINAIRQLKIEDYVLALHLHRNTEKRNKQTVELVERYGLKYHIEKIDQIGILKRLRLLVNYKGNYNRVFLGTHLYQDGYYYALKELKNGGNLVLLDDGVATLTLLERGYEVTGRSIIPMAWNKMIATIRGIVFNNVLTVYKGIDNPKWNIAINELSLLGKFNSPIEKKNVFFIGTNNSGYINKVGVDEKRFKQSLYEILKKIKLKHPKDDIIYVPHGRDKSTFAISICDELAIEYKPLEVNVEIYLLSLSTAPLEVYGFTSSALYNIKQLFPESNVNNVHTRILTERSKNTGGISSYYEKHGICTIEM